MVYLTRSKPTHEHAQRLHSKAGTARSTVYAKLGPTDVTTFILCESCWRGDRCIISSLDIRVAWNQGTRHLHTRRPVPLSLYIYIYIYININQGTVCRRCVMQKSRCLCLAVLCPQTSLFAVCSMRHVSKQARAGEKSGKAFSFFSLHAVWESICCW